MPIVRAYKFRAYPTRPQQVRCERMLRHHCDLYNAALQERRDAWRLNRVSVQFKDQCAQLKDIRAADPSAAQWSSQSQQRVVRRVDRAFQAFFGRVRRGERPGFPRFKSYRRFDTVDFTAGNGAQWGHSGGPWARACFKGVGHLKVKAHRTVEGKIKTISLKREADGRRWYVVVVAEVPDQEPSPSTGREVGVDLGVARFLTTSDGEVVGNPRFLDASAAELAALQQEQARCRPGSGNYRRLKRRIAKLHRRTANRRRDFHHKLSRRLVDECDTIVYEHLNVAGMTRRAKPKPDPDQEGAFLPNGGARKTGLNRSIGDVAWSQFVAMVVYKAEEAGRRTVAVDPRWSSMTCHICEGRCTRPRQDTVICPQHGRLDADLNAARVIATRAGLVLGLHQQLTLAV